MASAIKQTPQSYTLLHVQCEYLRSKGRHDWAVKLARQAVNCAPSEFVTWEKLTECYIDLGQYENVGIDQVALHPSLTVHYRRFSPSTHVLCSPTMAGMLTGTSPLHVCIFLRRAQS